MSHGGTQGSGGAAGGVPAWIASGIIGLVVGAGAAVLGLAGMGFMSKPSALSQPVATSAPPMGMMGGGMGGMMGGRGGGAPGGGGGGGKRALTSLVGKLELLSRPQLTLRVDLAPEQVAKLAPLLAAAGKAETMSGDEAEALQKSVEAILSAEQNEMLAQVGLPFGRGGGGGGGRGAGGAGGGGRGGGMMGGMPASDPDENPFAEESAKKRLEDLLSRLQPSS